MQKICKKCTQDFIVTNQDLEFYKKVSPKIGEEKFEIPTPTLCPDCRQQRRLAFRNERNLYKRNCDATGENIISMYSPDKIQKVYNADFWWSDKWDAFDYGFDFDFNNSFFEQFISLWKKVPVSHRIAEEGTMSNSDYCMQAGELKDCYLSFECALCENCYYSSGLFDCNNCLDSLNISYSENCLNIVEGEKLYNCFSGINLKESKNCSFCIDCIGCEECFLSSNLRNKKYYFKNEKYSKDKYYKKIKEYLYDKNDFINLKNKTVYKNFNNLNSENVLGDYLKNSSNCHMCYSCSDTENSKYCDGLLGGGKNNNCMDISTFGIGVENSYESQCIGGNPGNSINILFSDSCWPGYNLIYCNFCVNNCSNLFGCIGLKNKSYCILNKQYSKEEYEKLVPEIIEKMKSDGEWGEFFPANISPFGYNETVAQEYFALEKDSRDVLQKHLFNWSDYESPQPNVSKIIPASKLPESIKEIPDDILNWAIKCEVSEKPFRIIKQELEFYRKHNLPVPKKHPDIRHLERMKLRNPRKLFDRKCDKCGVNIKSTYKENSEEIVYCEGCYEKEVY